ncbi:MAG: Ldh family oxidoreductase [Candidatus Hadarchaeales archaeon]
MVVISFEEEIKMISALLMKLNVPEEMAKVTAEVLAEGDARGFSSHGLLRLPYILRALKRGTIIPNPEIKIVRETAAAAMVDGGHGLGHPVAARGMKIAIEKAKRSGVGCVGIKNTNHFGIAGYYAEMATREGLVGIVTTTTDALVHPWGGVEPVLGTNALAVGIPWKPHPILLDMAMSVAARGKIVSAAKEGVEIPLGWAVDSEGKPTTDPRKAIAGALSPFGGVKGYGLTFVLEILAGPLVGGAAGREVVGTLEPVEGFSTKGDLLLAIDPRAFVEREEFLKNVERFVAEVKGSKRAVGVEEILVPGEPEFRTREKRLREGIPIADEVWEELGQMAKEMGVDLEEIRR